VVLVNFSNNKQDIVPTDNIPTLDFDALQSLKGFDRTTLMAARFSPQPKRTWLQRFLA
jgi:hypothetical protein